MGRRVVIGLIILVAILLITIVALTTGSTHSHDKDSCELIDKRPKQDPSSIQPLPSGNNRALIRFAGYVKISTENSVDNKPPKYMDLKQQGLEYSSGPESAGMHFVDLDTDCAKLEMEIHKDVHQDKYFLRTIVIRPKSSSDFFVDCKAKLGICFDVDKYYSCEHLALIRCEPMKPTRANSSSTKIELQIVRIDLEIDGDPTYISSGKFSKEPDYCH